MPGFQFAFLMNCGNHSTTLRHRIAHTITMDRTRPADRSQLIRSSMVLFAILALVSFALASISG